MKSSTLVLFAGATCLGAFGCGDDSPMMGNDAGFMDGGMDSAVADAGPDSAVMDAGVEDGGGAHQGDITMGRLVVADDEGNVRLYDLDDTEPALLDTFALTGAARVSADINGRMVYLVQRGADLVNILDSGVIFESHVDHYHITKQAPSLTDHTFMGPQPTHFVRHGGWVAAFYDGSGDVDVMQERTLLAGSPVISRLSTGPAHHGVAVVAHGHVLATIGTEGEALPAEVGMWESAELTGAPEMRAGPCPGLHGEAAAGDVVAFGCSDGILLVERHGDHFDTVKVDNPDGTPEGTRTGALFAHDNSPWMWGNYGQEGFVLIDPEAGTVTATMTDEAPSRFAFDMEGEHVFVLTVDGMLHRFEVDGTAAGQLQVIDAFTPAGHGGANPLVVAGAGRMYVSSPASSQIVEVHIEDFEVERTLALTATPTSFAVVSVSPDYEEGGHDHEH